MRERLWRSRSELKRRRILIASADRVLITSLGGLFDGINNSARDAVTSKPEFSDLMSAYIAHQGGCAALVKQLQQ